MMEFRTDKATELIEVETDEGPIRLVRTDYYQPGSLCFAGGIHLNPERVAELAGRLLRWVDTGSLKFEGE
jgi:hypothetical protein